MKDSAEIKQQNKSLICSLLAAGQGYTKQQIAVQTGLSVASCNTYLNEMEQAGEVLGEKQQLHAVGRTAAVYRLNEEYESFVCLDFELVQGKRRMTTQVLSPTGKLRLRQVQQYDRLPLSRVREQLEQVLAQFPNASRIVVGTPSIAEHGVIRHCDIPELEGKPLVSLLEQGFGLPVSLANDMYYKIYGYYRQEQVRDQIVTLVNYPSGVLPGTATLCNGTVLTGRNLFAGMVGFLDYGMSREEQIRKMHRPTAEPLMIQAVIALISILNPHRLLFTGDLIRQEDLERIRAACRKCIPEEYMPDFGYLPDVDRYYRMGMFWTAREKKEEEK